LKNHKENRALKIKRINPIHKKFKNGPFLIYPDIFEDQRGYFYEMWNQKEFNEIIGNEIIFCQDNISFSKKGVLRGLHYQINPKPQGKLVSCRRGAIYDVAIDLRKKSSTFGMHCFAYLTEQNKYQFWIPAGFAHGFLAIAKDTEVQYKVQGPRDINCERSIKWDDSQLAIDWPLKENGINEIILSDKDANASSFSEIIESGDYFN
jgi:dTDP-4-dehydrorhamnose 3,5-epimerase